MLRSLLYSKIQQKQICFFYAEERCHILALCDAVCYDLRIISCEIGDYYVTWLTCKKFCDY